MIKVNASPAPLLEAALFVVCLVLPAAAQTSVDSCGSTLSSSGSYVVKGTLTASSGNCIEVTAPNVILDLSDGTLVGPGDSGTAVLIHKQAKGAFVFGGVLQGWDVGVEVDSARTVVSDTDISRGANTGVFLNGARKAVVADIDVSDIRQVGVHVRSSSFCTVENVDASTNGEFGFWVESSRNIRLLRDDASESGDTAVFLDHARKTVVSGVDASAAGLGVGVGLSSPSVVGAGVHLLSSSFSTIVDVDASRAETFGFWLQASRNNQVLLSDASSARNTGVYIGCSSSGPIDAACKGVKPSVGNVVQEVDASGAPQFWNRH